MYPFIAKAPRGNRRGLTVVELIVSLGISGIVALGAGALMHGMMKANIQSASHRDILESTTRLRAAINRKGATGLSCSTVLKVASPGKINPSGDTDVTLDLQGETFQPGKILGQEGYRIDRLYMTTINSLGGVSGGQQGFTATLFLEASQKSGDSSSWKPLRKSEISTFSVFTAADLTFRSCNTNDSLLNPEELCDQTAGMIYLKTLGKCVQNIPFASTCSGGGNMVDGACVPPASKCAEGQVAADYDHGIVSGCVKPTGYDVLVGNMPPPPSTTLPTSCTCGNSTVGLDGYCVACNQDKPTLVSATKKYIISVLHCNPNNGNLEFISQVATNSGVMPCDSQLRPAVNCAADGSGCVVK